MSYRHIRAGILVVIVTAAALLSTVPSFQVPALTVAVVATAVLGWLLVNQGRQAEADAQASGERLRSLIDSAVDGIIVIGQTGRIESFNPAAERLFGYRAPEVVGRNVSMLMPSPYQEEHDGYLKRYLTTGEARIIGVGREVTGRRRDGTIFPVRLSVGEMTIGGERKFTGILHDLTERLRLEQQLREGAALAKVGEMAAVIAHEVKNPLAGIRGAVQVIGSRMPADSRDGAVLIEIVKRIDALDGLIKDLLLFARPPEPRRASVDVGPLVTMTADLLRRDPSFEHVIVGVSGSAPPLFADAEMLKIVFQNLLVNSAHAMQGHGKVDVAVESRDGACVMAFTDTGPGIAPAIRDKIFTPFFTTKSRGTGLGLPTAKRLIEAHQGEIHIDCPPGGGTRVTVTIPTQRG